VGGPIVDSGSLVFFFLSFFFVLTFGVLGLGMGGVYPLLPRGCLQCLGSEARGVGRRYIAGLRFCACPSTFFFSYPSRRSRRLK